MIRCIRTQTGITGGDTVASTIDTYASGSLRSRLYIIQLSYPKFNIIQVLKAGCISGDSRNTWNYVEFVFSVIMTMVLRQSIGM